MQQLYFSYNEQYVSVDSAIIRLPAYLTKKKVKKRNV